jgi:hypothetical protein
MERLQCRVDTARQTVGAIAVALKQVVGHALRRFRTNPRQAAQGLDKLVEARRHV